jgi:hypothetical protein
MRIDPRSRVILLVLATALLPTPGAAQWLRSAPVHVDFAFSDAVALRTASHNEVVEGDLRALSVQFTRAVFRTTWRGQPLTVSWLGEALPVMLVKAGAPTNRVPTLQNDREEALDPLRLARYETRDVYGFGLAPFGAEVEIPLSGRVQFLLNTTAGGVWFNKVVPYGRATQANFTVAPGAAVQIPLSKSRALAVGYALHHLSNASFGDANPGLNSHLVTLRIRSR